MKKINIKRPIEVVALFTILFLASLLATGSLPLSAIATDEQNNTNSETTNNSNPSSQSTITFNLGNGNKISIAATPSTTIPTPTIPAREGYTFLGWYVNNIRVDFNNTITVPSTDIEIIAHWQVNQYSITYHTNNGTAPSTITDDYDAQVLLPLPRKVGHTFAGWYKDSDFTIPYTSMTIEAEDLNLYAKWNVNKYTISYDLNGADGYIPPEIIEYGTPVSAPATPSRVGYTFLGWKDSNGEYEFTTMPAHNVELFADWQVNQYTVTFDADNGTTPTSLTGDYDTDFIAPAPEKTGYTFLGWYLKENPSLPFPYETFIASDLNLIAKWRINQYTISFDTDGGSEIPSITADYGTPVSAPAAPVKEGYTFLGWYLDGIRLNINDSLTIPAKNLTLIAHWSKNEPAIPAPVDPSPNIPSENNTPVANDDVTTPSSEDSLPSSESSTYYNGSTATRSASPNNSSATSNSSSDKTPDSSANPSHPADNTVPTNSPVSSITPSKVSPLGVATDSNSNSENTFLGTVWDIVRTISPFACLLMLFFIPLLVFKRHEDEAKRKVNKDK